MPIQCLCGQVLRALYVAVALTDLMFSSLGFCSNLQIHFLRLYPALFQNKSEQWMLIQNEMLKSTGFLLPLFPTVFHATFQQRLWFLGQSDINIFMVAKLLIAVTWKSAQIPTRYDWIMKVQYILLINKLSPVAGKRHGSNKALSIFKKWWCPFLFWDSGIKKYLSK